MKAFRYPIDTGGNTVVVKSTEGVNASFGWIYPNTYGILLSVTGVRLPESFIIGQIKALYDLARKRSFLKFVVDSNSFTMSYDEVAYLFAYAAGIKQIPENIIFEVAFLPLVLIKRSSLIF